MTVKDIDITINNFKGKQEVEDKNEKGVIFVTEANEMNYFKCAASDYKTCPCDNLKKYREKDNQKANKNVTIQEKGSNHLNLES